LEAEAEAGGSLEFEASLLYRIEFQDRPGSAERAWLKKKKTKTNNQNKTPKDYI
jgi:hypothetical protein